jgi:hypothetical protein
MTSPVLKAAVVDPILAWIRISKGNLDPDPGKLKGTPKKKHRNKLMFLWLDVLSVKLEVSP